jgi:hypothetical protein
MESWEGVDGDGRVSLLTEALLTGRPPCGGERERAGVSEGREVGDDRRGRLVSERGRASGLGRLLGCVAEREWAARLGRTAGEKESARLGF